MKTGFATGTGAAIQPTWAIEALIQHGGTRSSHTHRHCGISDRSSVGSGAGAAVQRGASVRFGDRRADRGRHRYAGRNRAEPTGAGRAAENSLPPTLPRNPPLRVHRQRRQPPARSRRAASTSLRLAGCRAVSTASRRPDGRRATTVDAAARLRSSRARPHRQISGDARAAPGSVQDPPPAKSGDRAGEPFDGPASTAADIASSVVAEFRRHLRTCLRLPQSIAASDKLKIKLRVFMTLEARLAADPS